MRLRVPTGSNRSAAAAIESRAQDEWQRVYRAALTPILELEARLAATAEHGATDSEIAALAVAVVDALRDLVAAERRLEELETTMLSAVRLRGDATVTEIVERTGISASTLRRRMRPGPVELRGYEVVPDPAAAHGWARL